ncbi:MAG: TolC family protein [Ferruginibacter sp.]
MTKPIAYFFLLLMSFAGKAQDSLSMQDAVNIALKNSLDIQLSNNNVEARTILNNIGVAGGLPLITASVNDNEQISSINQKFNTGDSSISRNAAATNALSSNIGVSMLLYNGNRVMATKNRLAQLEKQSQELLNSQVQSIISSVMTGYYDIVRQQSYLKTIERSIEASRQQLEIVQTRQKAGLANNADLFQAQIDLNALLQAQMSQQVVISQSKTELLRLLTLRPDSVISVKDTILVDKTVNLDQVLNSIHQNPDIIAAGDQVRINELIVKETAALRYPSLRANTGYNFSRNQAAAGQFSLNQNYGPSIGFTIGVPIYNGSVYKRQQRVAEIDVRNAELDRKVLIRDYSAQVVKAYQSYASTLTQLETEQQNYTLSGRLLELVLQRFRLREATIVEVRNAQQSFEESGYRLVNLNFAAKSSEIELKRLANQLKL